MGQNKENTNSKLHQIQCIWMDAGVVRYKLCSAGFDCENCLFDKVMKNDDFETIRFHHEKSSFRENDLIGQKIEAVKEAGLAKGNLYLKNNLMVKKLLGKTYYLGLTPLAYTLLENIAGFNYCRDNVAIRKGDSLVQFIGDWGSIKILSPLNFYCLGRLKQELNDFSSREWFSLIEIEHEDLQKNQISEEEYLKNCDSVESFLHNFKAETPQIGIMMNDGGEKLRFLYQILGTGKYYPLLEKLFSRS